MTRSNTGTPYLRLSGGRRLTPIRQASYSECGLACLAMIATFHGKPVDLPALRRAHPLGVTGVSLARLTDIAIALGFSTRSVALSLDELRELRLPCILHWRFDHFVVLERLARSGVIVCDPARGRREIALDEASDAFTGVAVELTPGELFERDARPKRLSLRALVRIDRELVGGTTAALLLALFGEAALLAAPYYLQLVIDEVLLNADADLLTALAVGFAGVALFRIASESLRQLTVQRLGSIVAFDLAARIMQRLLNLNISYFESRSLGDLQHRVQALDDVQRYVVSAAPRLALDSGFCLLTGVVLVAYEPVVALIVVAVVIHYLVWRLAWLGPFRRAAEDIAQAEAGVQSTLLDTLRSMTTIKLNVGETGRAMLWLDDTATALNARIRGGNLAIVDQAVAGVLFGLLRVVVVFLLAREALNGAISVGMMSAFVAYYGMFNQRALAVVGGIIELKLLSVPLERLADVVFGDPEPSPTEPRAPRRLHGALTLDTVSFRYSPDGPALLRKVSIDIRAGEFVVIVGQSGSGKSSLLKLLCGLLEPVSGAIRYDGRDSRAWSRKNLRGQISSVLQDDRLVAGTLAENIALGAVVTERKRVIQAAIGASVHADVARLPLGYDTRAGDIGAVLSAGQVQRLLLARALYRLKSVLVLDEVTSGLDAATERRVLTTIAALDCTRVFVTHRPAVTGFADRVLELSDGQLVEGSVAASGPAGRSG